MHIKLNAKDQQELNNILEQRNTNIAIADMMNIFFNETNYINEVNSVDDYLGKIKAFFDIVDETDSKILDDAIEYYLKELDIKDLTNNPYYKDIKIKNENSEKYKLSYESYKPYQAFPYDDIEVDSSNYFLEKSKIGYYKENVKFPVIKTKEGTIWMAITPNEINTSLFLNNLKGNVCIFGLGLGYYAYMCSINKDVSQITIIEKDKEIIELFKREILPQFENKNKINILNCDAIDYIKIKHNSYNYALVDLWHDGNDGLPLYKEFKTYEDNFEGCKFYYWLEESIIAILRRCVIVIIEESLLNYNDDNYLEESNEIDKIINDLYFKTKNLNITNFQQIKNLLSKENLIKLL